MYGFNTPGRISAIYYHDYPAGEDPEDTYVFPIEERALYETFLWTGQVLALLATWQKQVCLEEVFKTKGTRSRTPRPRSGVHLGLLLSSFEEARGRPTCFGPEPRDQEVQRTTHGLGKVEMLGVRKVMQGNTPQARSANSYDEWSAQWDGCGKG